MRVIDWLGPWPAAEWPDGLCIEPRARGVRLLREAEHVRIGRGPGSLHFELRQDGWIACAAIHTLPESEWLTATRVLMAEFREEIARIEANA